MTVSRFPRQRVSNLFLNEIHYWLLRNKVGNIFAMKKIDLLVSARWVLPIAPENVVLEDHAVAVQAGRLIDLLPQEEAKTKYAADKIQHCPDHVLMPGLINAHTHTPMSLFRGLADDLKLMNWLQNHIWPAEAELISKDFLVML